MKGVSIMNADFELYKVFYTVASCQNISQAAEALYISQPAVSKSIKKLEETIGVTLFSRNSRGVKLTEEGIIFYDYVKRAINEISAGEKILGKLKMKELGKIKIGINTTLCKRFLIPHLKNFIEAYPNIQIVIINKTTDETLKLLDEGVIDFGIVSYACSNGNYDLIKLLEIQDIFVAEKKYWKMLNAKKQDDIFAKGNLMLLERNNVTRSYIDKYLSENNINIVPEIEISNMDLLIDLAEIGLGITVATKEFITKELESGSLIEIPINPPMPKRTISVVCNSKIPLSIAAQTFISFITEAV